MEVTEQVKNIDLTIAFQKGITISQVKLSDLPAVLRIERLGFSAEEAGTEQDFYDRIQTIPETFLIARYGQQIVGFIVGPAVSDQYVSDEMYKNTPSNLKEGGHQLVLSIATDPAYRGHGIGSQLLAALEKVARAAGRKTISLDSLSDKIPFYEKNGFQNKGVSASSHADETWYNMVKVLEG